MCSFRRKIKLYIDEKILQLNVMVVVSEINNNQDASTSSNLQEPMLNNCLLYNL